ncbi:MAG: phosphoadenylyl-sulfate reductase [Myxococcales bacterium]|nr:phosphoadenylyl-sulfate reductase [Myxococcales bacterium]
MKATQGDIERWQAELAGKQPYHIMAHALAHQGSELLLSFSGAEDVLLIDLAWQIAGSDISVFTLDTGRLHKETYAFIERVRDKYGIQIDVRSPDADAVGALVRQKGLFSFRTDGHKECCGIRKVAPLRKALASANAWATGQRRDQSLDTRADLPVVQLDPTFEGPNGPLVKYNPLANWTSAEVWRYIRGAELPYNALHEHGYVSIGCEPCTRAVLPGQHEREGRWWWEASGSKECGLHTSANDGD